MGQLNCALTIFQFKGRPRIVSYIIMCGCTITVDDKDMDIFSKIAAGEIPSYKCAEDERFYAFLDINPVAEGHTLVIPRREVDYIFDMDDDEIAAFQVFTKKVATALKKAFPCRKVAQVVLGLEVPHAHIHLIPMNSEADVDFHKEKLKLTDDEFKAISSKIYAEFTAASV